MVRLSRAGAALCGILLLTSLFAGGCAFREKTAPPDAVAGSTEVSGVWLFRHKVNLTLPSHNFSQSFDGLMRLDADGRAIRVSGLGGLGLQFFDMEIGPDWMRVVYLHPSLRKIPRVTGHIASCIRRIWFDCLNGMPHITPARGDGWSVSATGVMPDKSGPDSSGPDTPWPRDIHYVDPQAGYTLSVRLLRAEREDTP